MNIFLTVRVASDLRFEMPFTDGFMQRGHAFICFRIDLGAFFNKQFADVFPSAFRRKMERGMSVEVLEIDLGAALYQQ